MISYDYNPFVDFNKKPCFLGAVIMCSQISFFFFTPVEESSRENMQVPPLENTTQL